MLPDNASSAALLTSRKSFRRRLLTWYRREKRPLPWRESPSLYKTVVSEFMLQQTQVKTVLPYFERWLRLFPDFEVLAAAPEARVLKAWEGLGYYSRARKLHHLARILASSEELPATPEAWLALPGIGPYTAAAVTSIALGAPAACVDGNVVRVLARLTADPRQFPDGGRAAKALKPLADALLDPGAPGDYNQALMELGATRCTRLAPQCTACPVNTLCRAHALGSASEFPRFPPRRIERKEIRRLWCEHRGRLLLHRASGQSRQLAELLELPDESKFPLQPNEAETATIVARKRRAITRFQITETILALAPTAALRRRAAGDASLLWVSWAEIEKLALSGPHRRWVAELRIQTAAKASCST